MTRGDRALSNSRNTVVPWCLLLEHAVPVQRGAFVRVVNLVMDGDVEHIPPIGLNRWRGILSVD